MQQRTLTGLLPRRAILAAVALMAMAALPAAAQDAVKVGMSGPFSGGLSLLGQSVRDGVEVAFAEINDAGGVGGRKLQFIAEDDGYEPMRTIASARKLVEQDKVAALLAVTGTAPSAALLPFVTESKTPMLFPYAFAHSLTTPLNRDVFTTLPEVRVQMVVLANYILKELKQTKVAAIYQNDDFGQDAVAGLEDRFGRDKVPLVKLPFDRGTTNFSGVVAQAKARLASSMWCSSVFPKTRHSRSARPTNWVGNRSSAATMPWAIPRLSSWQARSRKARSRSR